jgi:hypothetical protein
MPADIVGVGSRSSPDSGAKARLRTRADLDGRTAAARLVRDLVASFERDLGGAGILTEGTRQLVQRAAVLGAFIEDCEARWIAGEQFETSEYLAAINAQRRVLATIGLERRAKTVPTIADYVPQRYGEPEREPTEEPANDSNAVPGMSGSANTENPMGALPSGTSVAVADSSAGLARGHEAHE